MTFMELSADRNGKPKTRLIGQHNDWFVPGLCKNELRRTWSLGFLLAIILFFAIPVAVLMTFSSNTYYYSYTPDRVINFLSGYFSGNNQFVTTFGCLGGMLCAIVITDYLFDRRKMTFACSMPVKRQAYLLTKIAASLTWSVLAWIPAFVLQLLVSLFVSEIRPHIGLIISGFCAMFFTWLCVHIYFFGLTTLACCLCGTGVMGACTVFFLGGYIPIAAMILFEFIDVTMSYAWMEWFYDSSLFSAISGVYRIFFHAMKDKSAWFFISCILLGILFIALGVLLTIRRKSENTGTPFAFPWAREIIKYLVVALAAILGAMMFKEMSEGAWQFFWMPFGLICGALLTWMLCNTVFYKTPKMMFTGKRGITVLTTVLLVIALLFQIDVFHLNTYVPSDIMTKEIRIQMESDIFTIRDKSIIRMYNAMVKNGYKLYDKYGDISLYDDFSIASDDVKTETVINGDRLFGCSTLWKTRYLLPIPKQTYLSTRDKEQLVTALVAQETFPDLYLEEAYKLLERSGKNKTFIRVWFNQTFGERISWDASSDQTAEAARMILDAYKSDMYALGADAMQQQYIGNIRLQFDAGTIQLPCYDTYTNTQKALSQLFQKEDYTYEKNEYTYTFQKANVYRDGEYIASVDESELQKLLDEHIIAQNYDSYEYRSPLTLFDRSYTLITTYIVNEKIYNYEYEYEYTDDDYTDKEASDYDINTYTEESVCGFYYGRVPAEFQS